MELILNLSTEVITVMVGGIIAPFAAALGRTIYSHFKK